jgi:hypothetical protein
MLSLAPMTAAQAQAPLSVAPGSRVGQTEMRELSFGTADALRLTIARIGFVDLAQGPDQARAARVEIDGLVVQWGTRRIEVPSIRLAGVKAPPALLQLLSGGTLADGALVDLLAKLSVDELTIAEVRDRDTTLGLDQTVRGVVATRLAGGVLDRVLTAGIDGRVATPQGPMRIVLGELRYDKIDVAESMRFLTGGTPGPAKRLLDRASLAGLEVHTGDGKTVKIARVELVGIDGRAPAQPLSAADQAALGKPEAMNDQALRARVARYAADFLRDFRVGRYAIQGLSGDTPEGPFTIASASFNDFGGSGWDLFEVAGIALPGPNGPIKIGRFSIEKVSYGAIVQASLDALAAGTEPDFEPDQIMALMPHIGAMRIAALDGNSPSGPFSLGAFDIESDGQPGAVPERTSVTLRGLKLRVADTPPSPGRDQLTALGYSDIAADAGLALRWSAADKALILENTGIAVADAGRVELGARLDGVDLAAVFKDPESVQAALFGASLNSLDLRLVDLGLAGRFYEQVAKSANLAPAAVREGLAAQIAAQVQAIGGAALAPGTVEKVQQFLRAPGILSAHAAPKPGSGPLTIAEMAGIGDPTQILSRLVVTVDTSPATR